MDVEFTSTGLRELAEMDGAVILDRNASRIVRAAVQLVPDRIPTQETGTRHRTAERAAIQTGFPVISVSKIDGDDRAVLRRQRRVLEDSTTILGRPTRRWPLLSVTGSVWTRWARPCRRWRWKT